MNLVSMFDKFQQLVYQLTGPLRMPSGSAVPLRAALSLISRNFSKPLKKLLVSRIVCVKKKEESNGWIPLFVCGVSQKCQVFHTHLQVTVSQKE